MRLLIQIALITSVLLAMHYAVIKRLEIKPHFAESNFISNQIRLQSLRYEEGNIGFAVTGSSLSARLYPSLLEAHNPSINVSLDGSTAILGCKRVLKSGKEVEVILIEMNTIFRDTDLNDVAIVESMQSGTQRLADYFPLVRAEVRPVTLLYSGLKNYRDSKLGDELESGYVKSATIGIMKDEGVPLTKCVALEDLIIGCKRREIRVVLMMLPDGGRDSSSCYQLSRDISARYEIEFMDLKKELSTKSLIYTDGLHLAVPSAKYVSRVISNTVNASKRSVGQERRNPTKAK